MKNQINKAYKFRFYPQDDLKVLLAKTFGCVRFVYNQTLDFSEKHYSNKTTLEDKGLTYKPLTSTDRVNYVKQLKDLTEKDIDKPNSGQLKYPWLSEVSSIALQQSARHLNEAYYRFFKGLTGKPTFKKKLNTNSFTITGKNSIHFDKDFAKNKLFLLPKYHKPLNIKWGKGKAFRLFNHLAVTSITVSLNPSGQYFISFLVKEEVIYKQATNKKCSIDLGLKTTAKIYEGKVDNLGKPIFTDYNLPELLKDIDKKLRKQQHILSRKVKGSKNRDKQRIKVARLHQKRSNIITDYYQKMSTIMVNENQEIVIEDLNISGMKRNRKLSRAIQNIAWKKLISMIEYKAKWHGRIITKANRYYPSSKQCSNVNCGNINNGLKLSEREWTCPNCNAHHDRDENACLNLYNYKKSFVNLGGKNSDIAGTATNARGGNVRPKASRKAISKKSKAVSNEAGIPCL